MMRALALALVLLLARPADAALLWGTGFDTCVTDTTGDLNYWSAQSGLSSSPARISISTTVDSGTQGNRCSLNLVPTTSVATYVQSPTFAASDTAYATIKFRCSSFPASPRVLFSFRNTSSNTTGALVTIARSAIDATKFQLRAYYNDRGNRCSASHTMDGTPCGGACSTVADCVQSGGGVGDDVLACNGGTCVHECDETAQGESLCDASYYNAQTSPLGLAANTWYLATLGHAKSGANVNVSLWAGAGTAPNPASIQYGSSTHPEGVCVGGANAKYACAANGDCASNNCDSSKVVQVTALRLGDENALAGTYDCLIDAVWVEDSGGPTTNGYVGTLALASTVAGTSGSTSNWIESGCSDGSEHACLNDGSANDGDTSHLNNGAAAKPTIIFNAATPALPSPSPSPVAVVVEVAAKDAVSGTSNVTLQTGLTDDVGTVHTADFSLSALVDNGPTDGKYHLIPPLVRSLRGDGTAWTHASLAALQPRLWKTAGSGDDVRASGLVTSVLYKQANPTIPTALTDRDGDGQITVTLAGDSTWADNIFKNNVTSDLTQPTNIIFCALGGTTIDDLAYDLDDILNGRTTQYMRCQNFKGLTGKKADVLLIGPGANNFRQGNYADPSVAAALQGRGKHGYCDMKGQAGEGNVCSCPINSSTRHKDGAWTRYWRVRTADWKKASTTCAPSEAPCSVNADCGPANVCCTGSNAPPGYYCTTSGTCGITLDNRMCDVGQSAVPWNDMCVPGCLNAPGCEGGICIANSSDAYDFAAIKNVVTTAEAYAWSPKVIVATAPPPMQNGGISCWYSTQGKSAAYAKRVRDWAKATSRPYVDIYARSIFRCSTLSRQCATGCSTDADCPGTTCNTFLGACLGCTSTEEAYPLCLRDPIHRSNFGNVVSSAPIVECLTQSGGTHDGACAANKCTAGRVGDPCSAPEDCDTWSCPSF